MANRVGDISRHGYGDGNYGTGVYGSLDPSGVVPITVSTLVAHPAIVVNERSVRLALEVSGPTLALSMLMPVLSVVLDELI